MKYDIIRRCALLIQGSTMGFREAETHHSEQKSPGSHGRTHFIAVASDMRTRSRAGRCRVSMRGVALVEAAVVIPVLLVFFGLILFSYESYAEKLNKQTVTRVSALYYASHNCKGTIPNDVGVATQNDPIANNGSIQGGASSSSSMTSSAGLQKAWNYAHAKPTDSTVNGNVFTGGVKVPVSRKIHAESKVFCNEEPWNHNNPITALIELGAQLFSGGAGLFGF